MLPAARQRPGATTFLRIVTHNAFWFQGVPFEPDRPGPPADGVVSGLVEIYRALRPDVLALQEVQDPHSFALLAEALAMPGRYCPGGELPHYGGAAFHRGGRYAGDWRSSPQRPQRMWQVVEAPGGAGPVVRVCHVHLPSSRQLGGAAGWRRLEDLRAALGHGGAAGVVVGDFNEPPGGRVGDHLAEAGYLDAAAVAGAPDQPTALGGGRGDQVWIHHTLRDRLAEYGVVAKERLEAPCAGKAYLSDHLPVWIDLAAEATRGAPPGEGQDR
jgi:endonuclease/exonuclease/phosphatase family metal-dependent hydrolase